MVQPGSAGRKAWTSVIPFFHRNLLTDNRRPQFLRMGLWCAIFIMFVAHPNSAVGQGEQGTITGTVTDQSGAVVPGAKVTVKEVSTQAESTTVTNARGYYTIPYLAPGTYDVTAQSKGFSTETISGVHLTVDLSTSIDMKLALGSVSQQVVVQAATAIQLETENSELGGSVSRQQILELPQLGRNAYNLAMMEPGVISETGSIFQTEINGGRANTSNLLLDSGTQINSSTGDLAYQPPSESVGQLKLITNNFSAEFGMSGGGVVTATTQSGANQFHGSVYEYLRNTILNANGWARNLPSQFQARAPFHGHIYGFSVGGPVLLPKIYNGRDKTFFFMNFEESPQRSPDGTNIGTVPTQAMLTGNFTGLVDQSGKPIIIYDPATTTLVSGNTWTRSQFVGPLNGVPTANVIDPSRISPIAKAIMAYYPLPTPGAGIQGIYNNSLIASSRTKVQDNVLARVDQNIGQNNKAFIRIGRSSSFSSNPLLTLAYPQAGTNGDPGSTGSTSYTGVVSETWTIRPTLLAEFRGNFDRTFIYTKMASDGFDATTLGLPASFEARVEKKAFPAVTMSDESSLGINSSSDYTDAEGSYEGQAHLTWVTGRHTIKTGFDYLFVYFNEYRPTWPAGDFSFSRGYTQGPNPAAASANAGWGFASFLLGFPSGGQITKDPPISASQKNLDGYVNDDYKLTGRLTLNIGLRYDVLTGFTDRHNQFAWFDTKKPDTVLGLPGSLQFVGVNGNRRNQSANDYGNLAPRLGFAYRLNDKTAIRGGYGISYVTNAGGTVLGSGFQVGTPVFLGNPAPSPNTPPPSASFSNPFAAGYLDPPSYLVGNGISDPFGPGTLPTVQSRNLSIQRAIGGNTVVTVGYAGSRGEHIWYNLNRNSAPISALSYGAQLTSQVPNPYAGKLPGALGAPTIGFGQTLLPFPQYTGVTWNRDPAGDSYYDALTVQVQHQDKHGLWLQLAYTLSKDIDDVPERYNGRATTIIDPTNLGRTRGVAEYDRPQYLIVNYVYQLPFGPTHRILGHGIGSQLLGNWQLSGITTYGSGQPIVITAPSNTNLPGIAAVADRLHDPHLKSGQTSQHWFDTTAYGTPALFTVGTGNRIEPDLRGPVYGNWDVGLGRIQQFGEGIKLELRLDGVNAFNNRNLNVPSGSVTGGTYGAITSSGQARNLQAVARLTF
jgi:hypothetical protein